ncbi:MAG: VWA domain-containing protein [Myxococcales bacterium]|jgi:hypothetical protein
MQGRHWLGPLGLLFVAGFVAACAADEGGGTDRSRSGIGGGGGTFDNAGGGAPGTSGFDNGGAIGGAAGAPGSGSTTDTQMPRGCASANVNAARVKPTVYFIIDGSGSMDQNFSGQSRWTALREALMDPDGVIPTLESVVEFGTVLYDGALDPLQGVSQGLDAIIPGLGAVIPTSGSMECPRIETLEPALDNFAAIDAIYPQQPLGGSTPTHMALQWAVDNLATPEEVQLDNEIGPQYIILATDGQPNDFCEGGVGADASAQVIQAAQAGAAKGVTMFVISLADDPNLQAHLAEVAEIGKPGQPPFSPSTKDDLVDTLTQIVGGAVGCDVVLNGAVQAGQECSGVVDINGTQLPCNDPNGWRLKDENTIEITGTACEDFKTNPQALLHADFPCGVFAPD